MGGSHQGGNFKNFVAKKEEGKSGGKKLRKKQTSLVTGKTCLQKKLTRVARGFVTYFGGKLGLRRGVSREEGTSAT